MSRENITQYLRDPELELAFLKYTFTTRYQEMTDYSLLTSIDHSQMGTTFFLEIKAG